MHVLKRMYMIKKNVNDTYANILKHFYFIFNQGFNVYNSSLFF